MPPYGFVVVVVDDDDGAVVDVVEAGVVVVVTVGACNIAWMVVVDGLMAWTPLGKKATVTKELLVKWMAVGSVTTVGVVVAKFFQYEIVTTPAFPASGVPVGHVCPFE